MSTAVCPMHISATYVTELRPTSVTCVMSVTSVTSATSATSVTCETCATSATSVTSVTPVPAAACVDQTEGDHRHQGTWKYELIIASVNEVCIKVQGLNDSMEFN